MDHFQTGITLAHLAETMQPRPGLTKQLRLAGAEMDKPQGQNAGAVGQMTEQGAAATVAHLAAYHLGLDLCFYTGLQTSDRGEAGPVLIT